MAGCLPYNIIGEPKPLLESYIPSFESYINLEFSNGCFNLKNSPKKLVNPASIEVCLFDMESRMHGSW